jgi:hypothetical protein
MKTPKTDHAITAAKELSESFRDTATILSSFQSTMNEADNLYDHGYGGAGRSMIKMGVTLVMIPEPFLVTDIAGCGIIAAGLLYNKAVPPPIYIDNVLETIQKQINEIHTTGENLHSNPFIPVDLTSIRFEI